MFKKLLNSYTPSINYKRSHVGLVTKLSHNIELFNKNNVPHYVSVDDYFEVLCGNDDGKAVLITNLSADIFTSSVFLSDLLVGLEPGIVDVDYINDSFNRLVDEVIDLTCLCTGESVGYFMIFIYDDHVSLEYESEYSDSPTIVWSSDDPVADICTQRISFDNTELSNDTQHFIRSVFQ